MILALKIFSLVKESDKGNKNYNSGLTPGGNATQKAQKRAQRTAWFPLREVWRPLGEKEGTISGALKDE